MFRFDVLIVPALLIAPPATESPPAKVSELPLPIVKVPTVALLSRVTWLVPSVMHASAEELLGTPALQLVPVNQLPLPSVHVDVQDAKAGAAENASIPSAIAKGDVAARCLRVM